MQYGLGTHQETGGKPRAVILSVQHFRTGTLPDQDLKLYGYDVLFYFILAPYGLRVHGSRRPVLVLLKYKSTSRFQEGNIGGLRDKTSISPP